MGKWHLYCNSLPHSSEFSTESAENVDFTPDSLMFLLQSSKLWETRPLDSGLANGHPDTAGHRAGSIRSEAARRITASCA